MSKHNPKFRDAAITTVQSLIEEIVLTPAANGGSLKIELEGALAGLLTLPATRTQSGPALPNGAFFHCQQE